MDCTFCKFFSWIGVSVKKKILPLKMAIFGGTDYFFCWQHLAPFHHQISSLQRNLKIDHYGPDTYNNSATHPIRNTRASVDLVRVVFTNSNTSSSATPELRILIARDCFPIHHMGDPPCRRPTTPWYCLMFVWWNNLQNYNARFHSYLSVYQN